MSFSVTFWVGLHWSPPPTDSSRHSSSYSPAPTLQLQLRSRRQLDTGHIQAFMRKLLIREDLLTVMEFLQLCSSCASLPPFLSDAALSLEDPSSKDSLCLSSQWPAPALRDPLWDESDAVSSPAAQSSRVLTHGPFHQRLWQQLCSIYLQQRSLSTKPVFDHHFL